MPISLSKKPQTRTKGEYASLLRLNGHPRLADIVEENWDIPIEEYAKKLWMHSPHTAMESALNDAFEKELERLEYPAAKTAEILQSLERTRVIQTAPHLGVTESPRMLTIQWLTTLGMPKGEYAVTGMFSGVPFSNNSRPGAINYSSAHTLEEIVDKDDPVNKALCEELERMEKDRERDTSTKDTKSGTGSGIEPKRISLFPSSEQNSLVYRNIVTKKLTAVVSALNLRLKNSLTRDLLMPKVGCSYTKWALGACNAIERKILKNERLVHLDINEVITAYLITVLADPAHPISHILFDEKIREKVLAEFGKETIFFYQLNPILQPMNDYSPETIIDMLRNRKLCPGIFLTFAVFSFMNGFACFGSFSQIEYLPDFGKKWKKTGLFKELFFALPDEALTHLTTGTWLEAGNAYYPIDILLGSKWDPDPAMPLSTILIPVLDELC